MFQRVLFKGLGGLVGLWMPLPEAHPLDLLLEEAEGAAAARAPLVILGIADA